MFKNKYFIIWGGIVFALNLFFIRVPLLNVVGYEFSVVNSVLLFLFGGVTSLRKNNQYDKSTIKSVIIVSLLPLLPGLTGNLLFSTCPLTPQILFYPLITLPAVIIGLFSGEISRQILVKYRIIVFTGIFLFIILSPVTEILLNPQVYFYNVVIGYYPGVIYDELIEPDFTLLLYRFLNILFFAGSYIMLVSFPEMKKSVLVTIIFVIAVFSIAKPRIGFATDLNRIHKTLDYISVSEHFLIYHHSGLDSLQRELLVNEHEYYYNEIKEAAGYEPGSVLTSFVFENSEEKKALTGAGNAEVAKPWLGQIYIEMDAISSSLKHEIVHLFSYEKGGWFLGLSEGANPAMIEGYAVAYEDDFRDNPLHQSAALAYKNGYKINIGNLFSGLNFFGNASSLSYLYSGSFLKYIGENYGYDVVNKLYADTDFNKYTGKSLDSLQEDYFSFLELTETSFNKHTANLYFGYKPLIKKVCPRYFAYRLNKARNLSNEGDYQAALKIYQELHEKSDSYQALRGLTDVLTKVGKYHEADSLLSSGKEKFYGTAYYYILELREASSAEIINDDKRALDIVDSLIIQKPTPDYLYAAQKVKLVTENKEYFDNYYIAEDSARAVMLLNFINNTIYFDYTLDYLRRTNPDDKNFIVEFIDKKVNQPGSNINNYYLFETAEYLYSLNLLNESKRYLNMIDEEDNFGFVNYRAGKLLRKIDRILEYRGQERESFD